jgi:hypothetical protein
MLQEFNVLQEEESDSSLHEYIYTWGACTRYMAVCMLQTVEDLAYTVLSHLNIQKHSVHTNLKFITRKRKDLLISTTDKLNLN